jgi:hypothetical protein
MILENLKWKVNDGRIWKWTMGRAPEAPHGGIVLLSGREAWAYGGRNRARWELAFHL